MHGKIRELAVVPGPDPFPFEGGNTYHFIAHIKTVTGGAKIRADTTANAAFGLLFPQGRSEHVTFTEPFAAFFHVVYLPFDFAFCRFVNFCYHAAFFGSGFPEELPGEIHYFSSTRT